MFLQAQGLLSFKSHCLGLLGIVAPADSQAHRLSLEPVKSQLGREDPRASVPWVWPCTSGSSGLEEKGEQQVELDPALNGATSTSH